ncbi:MAG: hypothetical protein AAGG80_07285, partial [Pseudomonadota bacterium]
TLRFERGERVKSLRKYLNLSRRKMTEKHQKLNLNTASLQNWEDGRNGGLTDEGARKLSLVFQKEGLDCRPEWLLYGAGPNPMNRVSVADPNCQAYHVEKIHYEAALIEELQLFQAHQSNVIDAIVQNQAMAPILHQGDFIAGERYFFETINELVGTACIIQLEDGTRHIGLLKSSDKAEHYGLECMNSEFNPEYQTLNAIKLFCAAPILWIRRKKDFFRY